MEGLDLITETSYKEFELRDLAVKQISNIINQNEELYLAQVIKMNPDIDPSDYVLCRQWVTPTNNDLSTTYPVVSGQEVMKYWLEKK